MTDLYGLTAQKTELEAIPENIRLGKTIFGVWPGTYSGGAGTLWVWKSQNTYWNIHTMPQYMVAINYLDTLETTFHFFEKYGTTLFAGIWYSWSIPSSHTASAIYQIDLITGQITYVWSFYNSSWVWWALVDLKYENDKVICNAMSPDWWGWWYYWNQELDLSTWTLWVRNSWQYTTWTTPATSYTHIDWKIFSIQPIISWEGLRTWNSGNEQIAWTWILVS